MLLLVLQGTGRGMGGGPYHGGGARNVQRAPIYIYTHHIIHYIRCMLLVKPLDLLVKSPFIDVIDATGVRSATAVNALRLGNRFMMLNGGGKSAVAA